MADQSVSVSRRGKEVRQVDPAIVAALIGAVAVIIAAVLPFLLQRRASDSSPEAKPADPESASDEQQEVPTRRSVTTSRSDRVDSKPAPGPRRDDANRSAPADKEALRTFESVWARLQGTPVGAVVQNWSASSGDRDGSFQVTAVEADLIEIRSSQTGHPQRIPRADFERVYAVWEPYCRGDYPRSALGNVTRFSTYVVSLLRRLEEQQPPT
jgi:hypothetical protein